MGAEQPLQATPCSTTEVDRRLAQVRSQLSTLTNALATVTQEKSRMEASFQADKRQLKQEMEELQGHLATTKTEQEAELHGLQQQLAECRARIITQQHEREQEQGDHVHQLRELQKILQQERDTRQDMELRLQDANATLLLTSQAADRGMEVEADLNKLREERDELRMRLQSAEEDQKKLDPRVEQLQQEVSELKTHLQQQVHLETRKVKQVETRTRPEPWPQGCSRSVLTVSCLISRRVTLRNELVNVHKRQNFVWQIWSKEFRNCRGFWVLLRRPGSETSRWPSGSGNGSCSWTRRTKPWPSLRPAGPAWTSTWTSPSWTPAS